MVDNFKYIDHLKLDHHSPVYYVYIRVLFTPWSHRGLTMVFCEAEYAGIKTILKMHFQNRLSTGTSVNSTLIYT